MERKTVFHWNQEQALTYAIRSADRTELNKRLLGCLIGIPTIAVLSFILMMLAASYFDDFTVIVLILGALGIVADIFYMVYLYLKHLRKIDETRCRYTELTITNDTCLLYEKHKHFTREQGFDLVDIQRIDYYTKSKQIVIHAPVQHFQPKSRKSKVRLSYLDTDWCFTENFFKEDILAYFGKLNIPINYIDEGHFVANRTELSEILKSLHHSLLESHEYVFAADPAKIREMMNQTLASRNFRFYAIFLCVLMVISLFVVPYTAIVFGALIIIPAIVRKFGKTKESNKSITMGDASVKINTYSDSLVYKYSYANQGTVCTQSLNLSDIKRIDYYPKSRKILIYAKKVHNVEKTSNSMLINDIFNPDLVAFLNDNIMPVNYKNSVYRWGRMV